MKRIPPSKNNPVKTWNVMSCDQVMIYGEGLTSTLNNYSVSRHRSDRFADLIQLPSIINRSKRNQLFVDDDITHNAHTVQR